MFFSHILFSQIADLNILNTNNINLKGSNDIIDIDSLNSKDNIVIYCHQSEHFLWMLEPFLQKVNKPFILISGMEDFEMPSELIYVTKVFEIPNLHYNIVQRIIMNPFFKHWFCVNNTILHEQITSIPYGLDFWTLTKGESNGETIQDIYTQHSVIETIANKSIHFSRRIPKIYANFHLSLTDIRYGGWRNKLVDIIPKDIIYYSPFLPKSEYYKDVIQYSFVVSPFGHGYDCIRTFEALCLGCIVIMKTSILDIIYEDLPILIVNEWSDINESLLNETLILYSNKTFNYNKLKMEYWIKLIESKF